jgi:hypothetical protein
MGLLLLLRQGFNILLLPFLMFVRLSTACAKGAGTRLLLILAAQCWLLLLHYGLACHTRTCQRMLGFFIGDSS